MSELDPRLSDALRAVRENPRDEAQWDALEAIAGDLQKPDEVGELYREVLKTTLPLEVVQKLGPRAVGFHEEWFGDDSPHLTEVLERVLTLDPGADWALQRATVLFTVRERWNELLGLYDRALENADSDSRRQQLLEEASQLAKDFASQPDRAVGYLGRLLEMKPDDAQLEQSIERLLERLEKWHDLVALWRRRLAAGSGSEPADTIRVRIATTWLEKVGDHGLALEEAKGMLDDGVAVEDALSIAERVLSAQDAAVDVRRGAREALRERYGALDRGADVERVLSLALSFASESEKVDLHRELAQRSEARGEPTEALEHWAAVLSIDPSDEGAEERLVALAERTSAGARLAEAFETAARKAAQPSRRFGLLLSAADVRAKIDRDDAERLLREVLEGEGVPARSRRDAARRLAALLDEQSAGAERRADRLAVLERLAELESEDAEKRRVLGWVARLATSLSETDRALSAWQRRLELDAQDLEALEAQIQLLEGATRNEQLAEALLARAALPLPSVLQRDDLVRAARVQAGALENPNAAIMTWRDVEARFGATTESVDALSELYARTEMHQEHAEILERATGVDAARAVDVLARLADVRGNALGDAETAASALSRAIQLDPRHAGARAGLTGLLSTATGATRAAAVEGLADAAFRTDDVTALLALLPHRLEAANSERAKVRLLRDAAKLEEDRVGDPARAFASVARAFAIDPQDESAEAELDRLARATGLFADAASVFSASAAGLADRDRARAAHLHRASSALYAGLGDPDHALLEQQAAFELEPHDAQTAARVVTLAADRGRFEDAATVWVRHIFTRKAWDESLAVSLETLAGAAGAWDAIAVGAAGELASQTAFAGGDANAVRGAGLADVARSTEDRLAVWHRDRRGDLSEAEGALARALAYAPNDVTTLRELARLQWRSPGKDLVDTLVRLSGELPGDLDTLHDAVRIAREHVGDPVLHRELLARLFREATRLWQKGEAAKGERPADRTALEAHAELVQIETDAGRFKNAMDWLIEGSRLPVSPTERNALLRRAGDVAREKLGDEPRAMQLYQSVIDDSLEDGETVDRIAVMYEARGRVPELLALKKRELELDLPPDRKLEVRLTAARLLGQLEDKGGRVDLLRQNLIERPGHAESISEITQVLETKGKAAELAEVLSQQARKLEETDTARAAILWTNVARTAETRLNDADRAISAWRRVVGIEASTEAYDALARLHLSRSEPGQAAEWLEKRFEATKGEGRTGVALELAAARLAAGRTDRAIAALERSIGEDPGSLPVREQLLELYRKTDAKAQLAATLAEGVQHLSTAALEPERQLAYAREAQALYRKDLGQPEAVIVVLEGLHQRAELDQEMRAALAEGYRAANRLDEARALLEQIVTEFGRRRSTDRALIHYQLAQVASAAGDLKEALEQLDKASSMDLSHAGILRLLGRLSREAGENDRSERAYRALLLLVRRQSPDAEDIEVGPAEVLWELSRLGSLKGQDSQARELHESALEAARQSPREAARFTTVLVARGDGDLAEAVIAMRLQNEQGQDRARALADRATVLETLRGDEKTALDARIEAFELFPDWREQTDKTIASSRKLGQAKRFADALKAVEGRARRKDDAAFATELALRLGDVLENDVGDLEGAAEAYAKAEALGVRTVDAWRALARVASRRGDRIEEIRVLRRLVAAGVDTAGLDSGEDLPESSKTDALYRIAEVELRADDTIESGLDTLTDAVKRDSDHARAAAIVRAGVERMPNHEGLLALWERSARQSGDKAEVLAFVEHQVLNGNTETVSLEDVREGSTLAVEQGQDARAEAILERGVAIARQGLDGLAGALWILEALSARRRAAGDTPKAMEWTRLAVEAADQSGDGATRDALLKDLAGIAAGPGGDPALAAQTYARLLELEPKDRELWQPTAAAFAATRDREGFDAAIRMALDALLEPQDRNDLRMTWSNTLRTAFRAPDDALAVLREVLDEDPDHLEASTGLADEYQRRGMNEELRELLSVQLDRARDRRDGAAVAVLSIRTGALLRPDQREEAMELYRSGLDWASEDQGLLRALYALMREEDGARERARLGEKLLAVEDPERASALALDLAAQFEALDEPNGVLSVLAAGFAKAPTDARLKQRLEAAYRSADDVHGLAEMIGQDAAHMEHAGAAVARYREAAAIWFEVGAPERAADVLSAASERAPDDVALLDEMVAAMEACGRSDEASSLVNARLETAHGPSRAALLSTFARLRLSLGHPEAAVRALEEALTLDPANTYGPLGTALEARRDAAIDAGDKESERAASLRLVEVLNEGGLKDRARDALAFYVDREPSDVEALRRLRDLDVSAARWSEVLPTTARLVEVESGSDQVKAALTLADAARRVGSPEAARAGLERAYRDQRDAGDAGGATQLRDALRVLYEASGAWPELAELILEDAETQEGDAQFESLKRAGELLVNQVGDPGRALAPLTAATNAKPDDLEVTGLLVDAMIGADQLAEAVEILQGSIAAKGRRRSPGLAGLQLRMGRIAGLSGDPATQLEWIKVALDTDKGNGAVAAELAELAIQLGDDATALNALKVVTLQKTPGPMSKAVAFLRQAQIAQRQGDPQKAVLWARRARMEDSELAEAEQFLAALGE
jgi:tetratricopeptide (TPR) repeat protein